MERNLNPNEIKILSLNLFLLPIYKQGSIDRYNDERQDYYSKKVIPFYDIVCTQEVYNYFNYRKQRLIESGKECGLIYSAYCRDAPPFNIATTDAGLVHMSRYPIVEKEFLTFSLTYGNAVISEKGVLYTKIKIGDSYLYLFSTHTNASSTNMSPDEFVASYTCRMDQLAEASRYIAIKTKAARSKDQIILCGDFNAEGNNLNPLKKDTYMSKVFNTPHLETKYADFLNRIHSEYEDTISTVEGSTFTVTDHIRANNNGVSPPTFGDVIYDP
jgi:endonuclease/exonuclease/phosphatase family metal-dependent hydrolase